jgi:hypothetical protein
MTLNEKPFLLKLDLQKFAEGDPQDPPQDPPANPDDNTPPADPPANPEPKPQDKTIPYDRFKQKVDEVNTFKNTLSELGFDDLDKLKDFASTAKNLMEQEDERKRQQMTEIDRYKEDLQKATDKITSLEGLINQQKETSRKEKLTNAFMNKAREKGVVYVDDALTLTQNKIQQLEVGENGEVQGLDDIIADLVSSKPYLLNQSSEPGTVGGSSNPPPNVKDQKTKAEVLKELADKARSTGKHEDMVAYMRKKQEFNL